MIVFRRSPHKRVLSSSVAIALSACVVAIVPLLEKERPAAQRAAELEYLPQGDHLRLASLGYRNIVADVIWMKVVQHFGERKQVAAGYRWAYHAVNVLTDLDPKFVMAYQATGTILGVWAGQARESIAILEKGMAHNPDVWRLPFLIGYDYYYELCEPAQAANYLRIASLLPGAPSYLPALAARMTVEGGNPEAALEFLARFHQQTRDERLQEALAQRMAEVQAEKDIRALENGARQYKARYGKSAVHLHDLVAGGIIERIPASPFRSEYVLNPTDGTVSNSGLRERLRVHRHTACRLMPAHTNGSQKPEPQSDG
jgi:hypothetical protein